MLSFWVTSLLGPTPSFICIRFLSTTSCFMSEEICTLEMGLFDSWIVYFANQEQVLFSLVLNCVDNLVYAYVLEFIMFLLCLNYTFKNKSKLSQQVIHMSWCIFSFFIPFHYFNISGVLGNVYLYILDIFGSVNISLPPFPVQSFCICHELYCLPLSTLLYVSNSTKWLPHSLEVK